MNNIFLPIAYTIGVLFTYNNTKAPKNLFETNLINTEAKNILKNFRSTIKENKSFLKLLDDGFIKNINTSMNSVIKNINTSLKLELNRLGYTDDSVDEENNQELSPQLIRLYKTVFLNSDGSASDRLKKYLCTEERGAELITLLCCSNVTSEKSIMQTVIGSGGDGGSAQENINSIQNQINQILEPNGIALLPIRYNPANGLIDLHFISLNGYPLDDTSSDPKLTLAGMSLSLAPVHFLMLPEVLEGMEHIKGILPETDILKATPEQIEQLTKEILSRIGLLIKTFPTHGTRVVYDPKAESGKGSFSITPLGPIENLLNSTSKNEAAYFNTLGGAGTISLSGVISGDASANEHGNKIDKGVYERTPVIQGSPLPADKAVEASKKMDEEDARKPKKPEPPKAHDQIMKGLKEYSRLSKILENLPLMDLGSLHSESENVRQLKYCLINITVQNVAREECKTKDSKEDFIRFAMGAFRAAVKEFADYKTKKVALPSISSTVPPTYKLPEKLLKLDYFLKINERNAKNLSDISDASDISALLTFIDEEQCKILLKQYREKFSRELKVEDHNQEEELQAQKLQCSDLGEPVLNK